MSAAVYCWLFSLNKAQGSLHLACEKHASVFSLVAPLYATSTGEVFMERFSFCFIVTLGSRSLWKSTSELNTLWLALDNSK